MKILIVDDNKEHLDILETILRGSDYEIASALNGADAMEKLSNDSIDMIISDILMPVMDGFQLCKIVKSNDTFNHIPFIFYTGTFKDKQDEKLGLELGADKYIRKPITADKLLSIIHEMLTSVNNRNRKVIRGPLKEVEETSKLYNKRLIEKLEHKVLELENEKIKRKETEEKFRAISTTANDAIIMIDNNDCISFWNRSAEKMFDYSEEEMIGKEIHKTIIPAQFCGDHTKGFKAFMHTGQGPLIGKTVELSAITKCGTEFPIGLSLSAVKIADKWNAIGIIRDITNRKKAEEQIKSALKEKDILLAEIHHRTKNNMQIIASILNLQSNLTKDSELTKILDDSQNRIQSMALVHEKLYETKDFTKITLQDYINELTERLIAGYSEKIGKITATIKTDSIQLDIDTIIPIGLIINELVTNSIKYAFHQREEKEIKIALKHTGTVGEFELTVSDNGIGIPENIDISKAETLGLRLVMSLSERQLSGKVKMNRDKGTEFRIKFKAVSRAR